MSLYLLPDTETLVVEYLKRQNEVDGLCKGKVAAEAVPSSYPSITLVLTGGQVEIEDHFASPTVELNAWAEKREDARRLCRTAHAALIAMPSVQSRGIVTAVRTLTLPRYLADPRKVARYMCEVRIFVHRIAA